MYARIAEPKWLTFSTLLALATLVTGGDSLSASPIDFGWGAPIQFEEGSRKNRPTYLAWPIQVRNNTARFLSPELEVVAVTDTGKQYRPNQRIHVRSKVRSDQLVSVADLKEGVFPSVTRRAVVVFEDVDPKASRVDFYVGGLVGPTVQDRVYLMVSYRRHLSGWMWEGTSFLD